jgi:hypothetical protein
MRGVLLDPEGRKTLNQLLCRGPSLGAAEDGATLVRTEKSMGGPLLVTKAAGA